MAMLKCEKYIHTDAFSPKVTLIYSEGLCQIFGILLGTKKVSSQELEHVHPLGSDLEPTESTFTENPHWIYGSGVLGFGHVQVENHGEGLLLDWHGEVRL